MDAGRRRPAAGSAPERARSTGPSRARSAASWPTVPGADRGPDRAGQHPRSRPAAGHPRRARRAADAARLGAAPEETTVHLDAGYASPALPGRAGRARPAWTDLLARQTRAGAGRQAVG